MPAANNSSQHQRPSVIMCLFPLRPIQISIQPTLIPMWAPIATHTKPSISKSYSPSHGPMHPCTVCMRPHSVYAEASCNQLPVQRTVCSRRVPDGGPQWSSRWTRRGPNVPSPTNILGPPIISVTGVSTPLVPRLFAAMHQRLQRLFVQCVGARGPRVSSIGTLKYKVEVLCAPESGQRTRTKDVLHFPVKNESHIRLPHYANNNGRPRH